MEKIIASLLSVAILIAPFSSNSIAQVATPTPPQDQQDERVVVTSNEVILDAVIKDKKGRPVTDLADSDFEIYEDGVRQQIKSMRLVKRETGASAAAQAEPGVTTTQTRRPTVAPDNSVAGVTATALVFDRLTPEARALARDAALSYVGELPRSESFIGVFSIDLALRVVQPYTTDARLVLQAVNNSGSKSSSSYNSTTAQVESLSTQQQTLGNTAAAAEAAAGAGGPGASAAGAAAGSARADQLFAQMAQRSLEVFEMLQRDQQGYATTNGLLAVVNSMQRLPGRKAIVFFSEGLSIPPAVQSHFRAVINSANRANVSVYAVDAAGLRVISTSDVARREISRLANQGIARAGEEPTGRPLTMDLERNEDLLRADPQSGLGQLANETGGLLIADTNNLKQRLRQVDEDLNTYYVLTYVPQNQDYDGRFRQISLKLKRSGLDVQSRKGYFAISSSFASPVLAYEAPALSALDSKTPANAFPVYAGALSFPQPERPGLAPLLVEAQMRDMTFASDSVKKVYSTDFSVVVLIKNNQRQVVRKLSNQYALSGPLDRLEAARRGTVLFYREVDLEPGSYTIEAVVYDALKSRASVRTTSIEVPTVDESKLRMSSLALIDRVEQLKAADKNPNNPFQFGDVLIYPNLGAPLSKSVAKRLGFFFTAQAAKGDTSAPKMLLEISSANRSLAQIKSDLPAPDASGRIQHASAIPLDSFQPGTYELKITITGAQGSASRSAQFTVQP